MVDVFKLNKDMVGNTYYIKPIPIKYNGKFTYIPPFHFMTSWPTSGFGNPIFRYFSYHIINGELKLNIYGNAVDKILDINKLVPITVPKVAKINVRVEQGFLDLSNSRVVHLDDCDINYKDKFIIENQSQYDELVKDISEEQLYQVVCDECRLVLSYSDEPRIIKGINDLLSSMIVRLRGFKIKRLMYGR